MYVVEYRATGDTGPVCMTLHEVTAAEFKKLEQTKKHWYRRIDAGRAHQMVKQDHVHTTALYVDMDGRVRKAKDDGV